MNYLNENLSCLKQTHPHITAPPQNPAYPQLEFFTTRNGALSAKLGACYLHSRFDPLKEAENLITGHVKEDISAAIFFGFGLGYHLSVFMRTHPGVPFLIVEPDSNLFFKVLEATPLREILAAPQMQLLLGPSQAGLMEALQRLPLAKVQIIKLRSVYSKDQPFYTELTNAIGNFLHKKEVNLSTLNRFGKLWVKNLVKNIELLLTMPGIAGLNGFFQEIPALIMAAGPSLDTLWPSLPALQQKMLIITVDTSLNACLARGVEPDFIIVVDPQYWNTRHLDWARPQQGFLVSESSTHPRVFSSLQLPGFFASSFFPLGSYFESIVGYKGKIGAGGSVTTSAWDFARLLGCSALYLAGLDLAFPGQQTHFRGAYFENFFHTISTRLQTIEKISFTYLQQGIPHYIEANDGTRVLSDKRMDIYRSWFETQMQLYPEVRSFNLSAHGARLQGMPSATLESLQALPDVRDIIERRKLEIRTLFQPPPAQTAGDMRRRLASALKILQEDLQNLEAISRQGLQHTAEIRRLMAAGKPYNRALAKLDELDMAIRGQTSRIIAGFLLQPVIQRIINAAQAPQSPQEIIRVNEEIYRELRDSARYHARLLHTARGRL